MVLKQYQIFIQRRIAMIYVGIDVAKDKHDCFITNSDGEVVFKSFTISNNREGFDFLFQRIISVSDDLTNVKVDSKPPDTIVTIFWDFFLIKVARPLLSTRYIPIFTEKV